MPRYESLVLANVIIPAFGMPQAAVVFAPWIALLVCLIEIGVLMPFMVKGRRRHAWWIVPVMNLASYLAGVLLLSLPLNLPTGIDPTYGRDGHLGNPYLPEWEHYVFIAFIVCYILSILLEWPVVLFCRRWLRRCDPLICSIAANTASYAGIVAAIAVTSSL